MPKLVKHGEVIDNPWQVHSGESSDISSGYWLFPLALFLEKAQEGSLDESRMAVCLKSDDSVDDLLHYLDVLQVIALQFDSFTDGRSFSQARLLRDKYEYSGEIRATGNYIIDQCYYLSRCGVDAFEIADETEASAILSQAEVFTVRYQAAADEPQPLFRRRG